MKKILSALVLFAAGAWAQNTTSVTASNITNLDGVKVASGKLCFLGTNSNDVPISFQMGGGGQVTRTPRCTTITNGAIGAFSVPNPANTSPANINYRITVQDDASGEVLTYRKVNFSGASFNFDTYVPDVGTVTSGTSVDNLIAQTFGLSSYADLTRITAPSNPPAGKLRVFADNSTGKLACLDSSGANCNPGGGGGGGDVSSNTSTSVDGEIALFSGTLGKTIKRASTSGILKGTSGVLGAATAGTDYVAPSTTITINGTANEIASSAGAQDLSANRSWTLSLPPVVDLSGKTSLKIPVSAGASPTASGQIAYDSTSNTLEVGVNGANKTLAIAAEVRYAELFSGADCGAKINAADSALGATAGEIWVNQACGTAWNTAVSLAANHVLRFVQPGTYTLSAGITIGQAAGIVGHPAGMANGATAGPLVLKAASASNLPALITLNGDQAFLSGITLDGDKTNNPTGGVGILVQKARANIADVDVWRMKSHGIHVKSTALNNEAAAPKMERVMSISNDGSGLYVEKTTDGFVSMSEFENNALNGAELYDASGWRLVHNDFGGNTGNGLKLSGLSAGWNGTGAIIVANQFGNNRNHDLFVFGDDGAASTVSRNHVISANFFNGLANGATANTYDAIHIEDSAGNAVSGNIVRSNASATYRYGARVVQNVSHTALRDTFTGNVFVGSAFGSGYFLSDVAATQFYGNDENGALASAFSNPYMLNNVWLKWKDSGGSQQNVLEMGADDNVYLNAKSGKTINMQVNSSTVATVSSAAVSSPIFDATTGFRINGAATAGRVLRGNGTNFVSAQLDFSDITGTVGTANGGTGVTSAADDNALIGNGSVWQSKALPSCSNATTSKLLYDTATNAFSCGTDQTGAGGSGITTLNTLTATTQDFTKTDDTNVTLGISSSGSTHTFAMGWTGLLGLGRGGTAANLSATGGAGKVLKQTSVGGAVTVANLASTELSDFSSSPCATNGQIPIWNISTSKYDCADPVVSGAQPAATTQNITATGAGAAVSVAGYGNVRVTVRGAYSGANISFEASPDGSNWFSVQGARDDSGVVESSTGALSNTARSWAFNVAGFTQFRLNTTTITSGTVNATITPVYIPIEKAIAAQVVSLPSLPAGSNVIGAVTQSGTWNVTVNAALPAGSNTIGGVNLAQYTPVSGRLPVDGSGVTQPVNLAQVAGTAVDTNSGNKSAGTQRVVIASDQPVLAGVGAGATGSAPPANAVQQGGTDGTNLVAIYVDPCERGARTRVAINQTANAQLITGTASKQTYICDLDVVTATAQNIALVEGTGTTCGTGTAGMAGGATAATGWNFAANGGLVKGSGGKWVYKTNTAADNVCLLQSGSGQVSGSLSYVQY